MWYNLLFFVMAALSVVSPWFTGLSILIIGVIIRDLHRQAAKTQVDTFEKAYLGLEEPLSEEDDPVLTPKGMQKNGRLDN